MRRFSVSIFKPIAVTLVATAMLAGCSSSGTVVSPVGETIAKQLKLEQQPEGINSLKAVYTSFQSNQPSSELASDPDTSSTEASPGQPATAETITVAGRIYALGMSPFDAKESVFTIMELPKQTEHKHEDPGDCPFCLRELKNSKIAIVRIVDSEGKTYPTPADKLLGLKKLQDIVVQGKASQVGDTLVIQLERLHFLSETATAALASAFHGS